MTNMNGKFCLVTGSLVGVNQTDKPKLFELFMARKGTTASLPAKCVGSYIWVHK